MTRRVAVFLCMALIGVGPVSAGSRLDLIAARGRLDVCIWPDYYGISYRNPKSQDLSGIDIDMAKAFADDLGVAVAFVDSSFARLVDDLLAERCDIAMFAIGVTPARQKLIAFSAPHLASDIYAITTQTNRRIRDWADIDKSGTVVAVAKGTLHEPIMRQVLKAAELLVLDTPFAREQEVRAGRADVFMTDYPYSQRFLADADWARLIAPPATFHLTPYAYAVKPGDTDWLARVNAFVADVKRDGRLEAAAEQQGLTAILAP